MLRVCEAAMGKGSRGLKTATQLSREPQRAPAFDGYCDAANGEARRRRFGGDRIRLIGVAEAICVKVQLTNNVDAEPG